MERDITERDWKVFKRLHAVAMDRFFERTVNQMQPLLWTKNKPAQERFWDALDFATRESKHAARMFDDFRRSTAVIQAGVIYAKGLLTDQEVSEFSEEMQQRLQVFIQLQDSK